ncbi:(2Fe-2S)-binding protein [Kineobactrum salinum]|uniref:(2Fe-2S)-binding protein n=1 Tax=Kineobactrum salinum TaxID=2708301 RepID=A0A6C0TXM0_9GAMM|nr:(2Fe-2S)-binding protein [Kineobactrum salinum]QIB64149.1 (2Fe-2S)-binding protein [Kineobactrum salinum]
MAHRIQAGVERQPPLQIEIDGVAVSVHPGETVASALLLLGREHCYTTRAGEPRSLFCNMGSCFECLVRIFTPKQTTSPRWRRACMTPVSEGMRVQTGQCLQETL